MTPADVVAALATKIPNDRAQQFVDEFITIRQDFLTGTLGRASPGKFVEEFVRILQFLESGKTDAHPNVDEYLRNVESKTALDEGLRLCAARVARSMYTLRNKRTIAHSGALDPNQYDLAYLYHSAQWILSELIRQCTGVSMADAGLLVQYIEAPITLLVEDFGSFQTVLSSATIEEEILALLRHSYPNALTAAAVKSSMRRRNTGSVGNSLRQLWEKRFVEKVGNGYKLTTTGVSAAEALLRAWTTSYEFSSRV